jgi:hypothetical protein
VGLATTALSTAWCLDRVLKFAVLAATGTGLLLGMPVGTGLLLGMLVGTGFALEGVRNVNTPVSLTQSRSLAHHAAGAGAPSGTMLSGSPSD